MANTGKIFLLLLLLFSGCKEAPIEFEPGAVFVRTSYYEIWYHGQLQATYYEDTSFCTGKTLPKEVGGKYVFQYFDEFTQVVIPTHYAKIIVIKDKHAQS
jgi:hypothetical protein